jgi:hypothetical protein
MVPKVVDHVRYTVQLEALLRILPGVEVQCGTTGFSVY